MRQPEYTLKQAIGLYKLVADAYYAHVDDGCEQCIGWFAEGPHCEEGHGLMLLHNKWIRRMRRVAKLEGVKITLPSPISEKISER